MSGESRYISIGSGQIHYLEWMGGDKLLLAFHGYGNRAELFAPFRDYLHKEYTILSIDLPHHGITKWDGTLLLRKRDLRMLVEALMKKYGAQKVTLMGYSMGGRVSMTIVECMPERIEKIALIATDGLAVNKLYYFCTRTAVGRRMFRDVLKRPERYHRWIKWLKKMNLVDPTRYRFVMQHLQSEDSRRLLLDIWMSMSDLIPAEAAVKRLVKRFRIPIFIFMGAYDRIMPPVLAEQFKKGLDTVQVFTLERGHRVFDDTNAHEIAKHLL